MGDSHAGIGDIAVRPDGRLLATTGWDGAVRIFHRRRMQPLALLKVRGPALSARLRYIQYLMIYMELEGGFHTSSCR